MFDCKRPYYLSLSNSFIHGRTAGRIILVVGYGLTVENADDNVRCIQTILSFSSCDTDI